MNEFIAEQRPRWEKPCTNVVGGIFYPNDWATEILDIVHSGEALAYLYRRFGFTAWSSDPDKEICNYELTSPMPGVGLSIRIKIGVDFAYIITSEIERECYMEENRPYHEWCNRLVAWAAERTVQLFIPPYYSPTDELNQAYSMWLQENYPGIEETEENYHKVTKLFLDEKENMFWEYAKTYESIEPQPPFRANVVEGDLRWRVEQAIRATIKDLLRPVGVRDGLINIKGDIEDSEAVYDERLGSLVSPEYLEPVEPSSMAGSSVPIDWWEDRKVFWKFDKFLRAIGQGSAVAGMKLVMEQHKKELIGEQ